MDIFDYGFPNNGLIAYRQGDPADQVDQHRAKIRTNPRMPKPFFSTSFLKFITPETYKALIKTIMLELSKLDLPVVRYVSLRASTRSARPAVRGNGRALPIASVPNGIWCLTICAWPSQRSLHRAPHRRVACDAYRL